MTVDRRPKKTKIIYFLLFFGIQTVVYRISTVFRIHVVKGRFVCRSSHVQEGINTYALDFLVQIPPIVRISSIAHLLYQFVTL
jgi:hypothetical protein